MAQIEKVNAAWDRIDKWYSENFATAELPGGAAAADITALETHMSFTLPEELKASLMRHNGVGYWKNGELLSVEGIKMDWECWTGLVDDGTFDDWKGEDNAFLQKCWWNKSWIPIHADDCGNEYCIDMNPGPKGTVGQIIFMDREVGAFAPCNSDFASYLEEFANELESGEYSADGGYLGKIDEK